MLILECVEQKKECRGPKWVLPISSLGSRHCSGVVTGGTAACMAGAPTLTTKNLRTRGGACLGRPVTTGLLGCSVATKNFLS